MKAIIIGCGNVGLTVAQRLVDEDHDVVLIDRSEDMVNNIPDDLDAMVIRGEGNSIATLKEAGIENADALIAVTRSDEVNLLCCLIAHGISSCHTIARVRDPLYLDEADFLKENMNINLIINPEYATAREISRLLMFPDSDNVVTFARNRILFTNAHIGPEQKLDGMTIAAASRRIGDNVLISAVERDGEVYIPNGSFELRNGDSIYILASAAHTTAFYKRIGLSGSRIKHVLIAGGSLIAEYLTSMLVTMGAEAHIIEENRQRAEQLSDKLDKATIILGDATDRNTLLDQGLLNADAFVTLMDADEENVMISLFAKTESSAKLVMKMAKTAFRDILSELGLESAVFPDLMTADYIMQYLRAVQNSTGNSVETLYHMFGGRVEAIEFVARTESPVIDARLADLDLKPDTLIGCINRHGRIIVPRGGDMIHIGDTVVVVTADKGLHDLNDILV
ncbi:MAG: Trk system potassium transporter TrkA [Anaerovoracaceae bacterium]|nr:Trk system potassium transporter TrkA [Bacillota bacterium]MDY2670520.1 Trk system potassium transporter TrkA [Anaerovoracaceae bacterium]